MENNSGYDDLRHQAVMKDHAERSLANKFPTKGRIKSPPVKSPPPNEGLKTEGYVPPTSNYLTFSEALQAVQRGQTYNTMSKMNDRMSTPKMMMNQYQR